MGRGGGEKKAGKLTPDAFPYWQRSAAAFVVCRTNPCCPLAIDYGTNLLGRRDSRRAGRCETLRGKDTDANTSQFFYSLFVILVHKRVCSMVHRQHLDRS